MPTTPRSALRARLRAVRARSDGGFTITEVTVAIALVTVVMTSLAAFFVNSARATDHQSSKQTAIQVATDAMEKARALSGVGVMTQRDKPSSDLQWQQGLDTSATTNFPGVAPYLNNLGMAYDTTSGLPANSGWNAPLPTKPSDKSRAVLDNNTYTQNWFLGWCLRQASGCSPATQAGPNVYIQIVVDVTWHDTECANDLCSYVTATLVSPTPDPTFDDSQSAPKPHIHNPGNQINDVGDAVNLGLQLTGGTNPITWSLDPSSGALPAGLHLDTTTTPVSIQGHPTTATATPARIVLRVVDGFGFVSTAAFTWTVFPAPALAAPCAPPSAVGSTVSLALVRTGGQATYKFTATGLPPGLSINQTTGAIIGVPTTSGSYTTTVTVTDRADQSGQHQQATATFTWAVGGFGINSSTAPERSDAVGTSPTLTPAGFGTGCTFTWTAVGLPQAMTINPSTGVISGTLWYGYRYLPTITAKSADGSASASVTFVWHVTGAITMTPDVDTSTSSKGTPASMTPTADRHGHNGFVDTWTDVIPGTSQHTLPPGLSINPSNGRITGTPTTPGRYVVTIIDYNSNKPVEGNSWDYGYDTFVWTIT